PESPPAQRPSRVGRVASPARAKSSARPGSAQSRLETGRAPRRRAPGLPFCACCLSKFHAIAMRHEGGREHGRFARSEAGYRATELGKDGRRARIELDPRGERKWKGEGRYRRQRDPRRINRGREGRQYAVDGVV